MQIRASASLLALYLRQVLLTSEGANVTAATATTTPMPTTTSSDSAAGLACVFVKVLLAICIMCLDTLTVFSGKLLSNQVCFWTLSGAFVSLVRSRLKQQSGVKLFGVVPEMCSAGSVRESISFL
eukprot:6479604-Amphidinium_carterae.1